MLGNHWLCADKFHAANRHKTREKCVEVFIWIEFNVLKKKLTIRVRLRLVVSPIKKVFHQQNHQIRNTKKR